METLSTFLTWHSVVVAVVAYYVTLVFYRLFLDPLARFPGPKLAAASRWYEAYYDVVQNGQYYAKIVEMHKKYGMLLFANITLLLPPLPPSPCCALLRPLSTLNLSLLLALI